LIFNDRIRAGHEYSSQSKALQSAPAEGHPSKFPSECGEVICRSNEKGQGQIYIVALGHRDALTRLNGSTTVKVQAEIYRIGDWLIHQEGIELLLPEGFFENKSSAGSQNAAVAKQGHCTGVPEMNRIEEKLACDKTYVNAEMLLKENHSLRLRQVEDETLYFAAREGILKLANAGKRSPKYPALKSELDYLQARRTAAMLQRIPDRVDEEFRRGTIRTRKALFTIGLSHVMEIIQYLSESKIRITAPPSISGKGENGFSDLNLHKKDFAVSIIIPRTLADDKAQLTLHGLASIVSQARKTLPPAKP
jgi:hypothetical protein